MDNEKIIEMNSKEELKDYLKASPDNTLITITIEIVDKGCRDESKG